jgi:hypothetical protein
LRIEGGDIRLKLVGLGDLAMGFKIQVRNISGLVVGGVSAFFHPITIHANLPTVQIIGVDKLLPAPSMSAESRVFAWAPAVWPNPHFGSRVGKMIGGVVSAADRSPLRSGILSGCQLRR